MLQTFSVRSRQRELDEELKFHLEQSTQSNLIAGMTAEDARRRAFVDFGSVEGTREQHYQQRPGWWMNTVLQDTRYALRGFRRNPAFAVTVIATLALGIGATTAVLSVVDRILFRSLPYAQSDRLVSVGLVAPIVQQEFMLGGSYYDWRDNQKPFSALTSETGANACSLTEHNPARLNCASVEQNFLPTMGIAPFLGRNFLPEEDRPNGPKVALISYGLWRGHYAGDASIVNRLIDIDGKQVRVVGVLPKDFEMPTLEAADVVEPQALDEEAQRKAMPGAVMYAFARLKPGVSIAQAEAALQPVFNYSLSLTPPGFRKDVHLRVRSLRDRQIHDVRLVAWIMFSAVLAVLLIACANVMSLLLARAATRDTEVAVRSALGASRGRLARQMLTETLLLSLAGAAAGCVLAEILLRIFISIAPAGIPFLDHAQLDLRIILLTLSLSVLCGIVFGVLPALNEPRTTTLGGRSMGSDQHAILRRVFVVGQIAISMVLLAGAGLLLRSFRNLEQQDIGLQTEGVMALRVALPHYRYDTPQKRMDFFLQAETAVRNLPGVLKVGISDSLPPGEVRSDWIYNNIAVSGQPRSTNGTGGTVAYSWVTPGYFSTLNIPILRGQAFTETKRTSSEHRLILSSLLASRLFGSQDPVGKQVQLTPDTPWYTVAAVAADVKNAGLTGEDKPEFYRLRRNLPEEWTDDSTMVLKSALSPAAATPWIRSQIAQIDSTVPVEIETLSQSVSRLADRPRFETALLGFFAFSGLLMAIIGLYGVISYVAAQRTREIGVRMALGATRLDILRLVAGEGSRMIVLGGAIGLAAAVAVSQVLKSLLFNVGPHDIGTYATAVLLLALVALAATLIPARAAMRVEPVVALRHE
jgi:predicted permease